MKRTISVIIALFIILGLRLIAYHDDALQESAPLPTSTKTSTLAVSISGEATPSSTPIRDSLAGEGLSEEVIPVPTPTAEEIVREVIPSPTPIGDMVAGEKLFASACKICHRKYIIHNDFLVDKTDQELFEFIKTGGLPNQPLVMQPKAGKPSLTDEKLYDIVAYLRSLQE